MCTCLGRICFAVFIILFTLPVWIIVKVNMCFAACCPSCLPWVHSSTKAMVGWAWWWAVKFQCCFLRLRLDGLDEMNRSLAASSGKPRLIILNHLSFMDALMTAALLSTRNARELKSLASAHLFAMPILGGIGQAAGHYAIPFKSHETKKAAGEGGGSVADFSVDKDAVAVVMDQFTDWVRQGNIGCWFPEGRLNPVPSKLQTFRAGGFKIALEVDCEVWATVAAGFEVYWHRKAPIGGAPASCKMKAFKVCDSTHSLVADLANGQDVDDKEKCLLIANYAQAEMQKVRDEFNVDPWVSKLPEKDDPGTALVEKAS